LLVPGTDVTPALGALAPRLIDDGSVNDPMTLAKRVDVTYPVYAPKWRHPVEATTEDPHRRSRHKPAIFPRGNVGTSRRCSCPSPSTSAPLLTLSAGR
jgi:hypothetical protein